MKKHLLLLIAAIILLFVSCEIFNPSPDPKQNQDPPAPQVIHVTGVSVDLTNLTLSVGDSQKLAFTITPADATDKTVSWSANAPSMVSVDQDGTVHALGLGAAIIKVKTADGGFEAACMVTVQNK